MSEATDATAFNSTARVETRAPSRAAAGRKRRRKTFSCLDCRQRKLKCDNVRPSCSRCQKVGRSAFCTYDSSSVSEARVDHPNATTEGVTEHGFQSGTDIAEVCTPSQTSGPPDGGHDATVQSLIQQLEAQNGRIAELEAKLSRVDIRPDSLLSRAHNTGPEGSGVRPTGDRFEMEAGSRFELEATTIKGREFETQLYGASHWMSPIINFPELRGFMKDAVRARSHTLCRLEGQLNALPKEYTREQTFNATDADLVALLPAKQDVDTLIGVYLENFETCYHILHLPTFWRDYGAFWASRSEVGAAYVVLMLLAIATARCATPDERYVSIKPTTSDPDWAKVRINECEAWLRRQSQKHLRSDTFQHHCLLVLAKLVNRIKVKAAWRSSVALVTFAMTTGLHRKYDFLGGKVSVFHQEMRRRFWTTITELELQAAFDRGMTCFTSTTPWDCERPANIDDADITEESQHLPESRPREEYTDAAFLHASRSSFELRSSLVSLINDPSTRLQPCHVLEYEAKINEELDMIPKWSSLSGEVGVWPQSAMVPQVLLATQLRQLLIAVHTPFAQQTGNDPRSSYSRLQCLNAAGIIIDQQSNLTASGYHGLALLRNDVIRASVCISKNLMLSNSLSNSFMFSTLSRPFYAFVETSLSMLEDSIFRIGSGFKDYWYISAAAGVLSTITSHHTDPDFAKQKSVERVIALYRRVFGDQITVGAGGAAPPNEEAWVTAGNVLPVEQMGPQQQKGLLLDQLDLEDLAHWTMDDLWSFDLNGGSSFGVGGWLY